MATKNQSIKVEVVPKARWINIEMCDGELYISFNQRKDWRTEIRPEDTKNECRMDSHRVSINIAKLVELRAKP